MRHALKNALIPVVTIIGMMFPILVGGTIIIEQIFGLPGMGLLMFQALNSRDYPVISGINVFVAAIVMFTNLIVDLAYAWLDPRVSYR
jgi:peptide/nickel transport system permease protein